MREFSFSKALNVVAAALVSAAAAVFGSWSPGMTALIVFMALDICSGWLRAGLQGKVSSKTNGKGVLKKLLILCAVVLAAQADVLFGTTVVKKGVILFYCGAEALSVLENITAAGLPVPDFLRNAFKEANGEKFIE